MALTAKMKAFALAKMQGKSNKEAAVLAGYSEGSAASRGSQLDANPEVIAYLAALQKQGGGGIDHMPLGEAAISAEIKDMENVTNSLEYLQYVYKNPRIDRKTRIEAAKAALPYEHGKLGEKGVKQGREDAAGDVADKDQDFATASNQRAARNQRVS
ncbi:hypothetical protein [Acinetobacter soli]|uniref:hypothetical protein n=1 Tax=Acinetobacter soli TaxID=487316 RepID=UPI0012504785|nr:hypothetical protein [Acinetobacter soli]